MSGKANVFHGQIMELEAQQRGDAPLSLTVVLE